jgi:hypothetical protein
MVQHHPPAASTHPPGLSSHPNRQPPLHQDIPVLSQPSPGAIYLPRALSAPPQPRCRSTGIHLAPRPPIWPPTSPPPSLDPLSPARLARHEVTPDSQAAGSASIGPILAVPTPRSPPRRRRPPTLMQPGRARHAWRTSQRRAGPDRPRSMVPAGRDCEDRGLMLGVKAARRDGGS